MVSAAPSDSFTITSRTTGRKLVVLAEQDGAAVAHVYDSQGRIVAGLQIIDDEPVLFVTDDNGVPFYGLAVVDGTPSFVEP